MSRYLKKEKGHFNGSSPGSKKDQDRDGWEEHVSRVLCGCVAAAGELGGGKWALTKAFYEGYTEAANDEGTWESVAEEAITQLGGLAGSAAGGAAGAAIGTALGGLTGPCAVVVSPLLASAGGWVTHQIAYRAAKATLNKAVNFA